MAKKKFSDGLSEGDIFMFPDGRLVQFLERWPRVDMVRVQFIDRDEETSFEPRHLEVAKNLGQSESVLLTFHSSHGIHKRLNRLSRV